MLVDDTEDGRDVISLILEIGGATVFTASSVAEALDILYSQLEAQIVTSGLNPESLAIETWTECDKTSFRVCARFVPR